MDLKEACKTIIEVDIYNIQPTNRFKTCIQILAAILLLLAIAVLVHIVNKQKQAECYIRPVGQSEFIRTKCPPALKP